MSQLLENVIVEELGGNCRRVGSDVVVSRAPVTHVLKGLRPYGVDRFSSGAFKQLLDQYVVCDGYDMSIVPVLCDRLGIVLRQSAWHSIRAVLERHLGPLVLPPVPRPPATLAVPPAAAVAVPPVAAVVAPPVAAVVAPPAVAQPPAEAVPEAGAIDGA